MGVAPNLSDYMCEGRFPLKLLTSEPELDASQVAKVVLIVG
jgi:hypothetical protein